MLNRRHMMMTAGAMALAAPGLARAQEAAALPPPPTSDQWAKTPDLAHVCLSPQGNRIAYIREDTGTKYMFVYDIAAAKNQTYNIGTAKIGGLFWIDEDHLCLSTFTTDKIDRFAGSRGTFEIATVYNIRKNTVNILYSHVDGFARFILGGLNVITMDGQTWITASSLPLDEKDDFKYLYRFDLDDNAKYKLMDRASWDTEDWIVTPQGDLVGRAEFNHKSAEWTLDIRVGDAWKGVYSETSRLQPPSLVGLAPDGKSVIIYKAVEGAGHYHQIGADGALSAPLPDKGPHSDMVFDARTFLPCGFIIRDKGWTSYAYDDPVRADTAKKAQAAVDGYRMLIVDFADNDARKVIIYTEGPDDAGSYYFIDFASGKNIPIGSSYPDIPVEWISEKQAITYKAADGLDIEAYLTLPPNREAKNLALVLLPHGGPQARDDLALDWQAETLAALGYAVLQPNYRGSDGYGQAFVDAGHGQIGRKMQTDLSDGVRYLAAQGTIDPKRVAIFGASYGGYAALAGATLDPGVYNCAVDVAGLSDLTTFLQWSDAYGSADTHTSAWYYWKDYFGDPATYAAASPAANAAACTVPVLIIHGKDDTVVPMEQSTRMVAALKAAGKDVTFVQYDHEDHWETTESARTDMMKTIVAFLAQHNPPGPLPA